MSSPRRSGRMAAMEHKTWATADKSGWGPGPWQDEPDKEQWTDEATGYACLLKRNRIGSLCGYVGIPDGHPWHGTGYDDIAPSPEVHGGLTYSDLCQEGPEGETICHVAAPGEPEPLWWLGFDCAHAGDLCPAYKVGSFGRDYEAYRTAGYVRAQCATLARQAAEAAL